MSAFPKTKAALARLRSALVEIDILGSCARIVIAPIAWPLMLVGAVGVVLWMAVNGDTRFVIEKRGPG